MYGGEDCWDGASLGSYAISTRFERLRHSSWDCQPYLEICEQPQSRGFRFRYQCEGESHGSLQGEHSCRDMKTYPSIRICGYGGTLKLTISLVTDEDTPRPHVHELTGKNCSDGVYSVVMKAYDNEVVSFPHLVIHRRTRKSAPTVMLQRLRSQVNAEKTKRSDNFWETAKTTQQKLEEDLLILNQAEDGAKSINLGVVRLCFQAYLMNENGVCTRMLPAVISNPIHDSKSSPTASLRIVRLNKVSGWCDGNEEVFLLCDKVKKGDIAIRFYERDEEGHITWEGFGAFDATDVHNESAIVFRTPRYKSASIERPVTVFFQLNRLSDNQVSEPKTFTYYPKVTVSDKLQQPVPHTSTRMANSIDSYLVSRSCCAELSNSLKSETFISANATSKVHSQKTSDVEEKSVFGLESSTTEIDSDHVLNQDILGFSTLVKHLKRISLSLQHYSLTGDARHLLMPNRHLIANKNTDGDNALHLSVIHKQSSAVNNLLSVLKTLPENTAINDQNDLLQTPLQLAVVTHQSDLVDLLLRYGADPCSAYDYRSGNSLLHISARDGDNACLKQLLSFWLSNKNSPKWQLDVDTLNYEGFSALQLAVRGGHLESVRLLVQLGHADVNLTDGCCGRTALHHAVNSDNLAIVGHLLLECSTDVDKADNAGNTPLHYATASGKVGMVALLIAAGANPNAKNYESLADSSSDTDADDEELVSDGQGRLPEEIGSSEDEDKLIGWTPIDMAADKQRTQMLRILEGEVYWSVKASTTNVTEEAGIDSVLDPRLRSVLDSGYQSLQSFTYGSRLSSLKTGE